MKYIIWLHIEEHDGEGNYRDLADGTESLGIVFDKAEDALEVKNSIVDLFSFFRRKS